MIRFAVMTFMFDPWLKDGRTTPEAMIEDFAREGVQGIEPFHTTFTEDPGMVSRYLKTLDATGISVPAVDVICDLVYASPAEKAAGRDDLRKGLDVCVGLGARVAHVAGHTPKPGVPLDDARQMIADGLSAKADFARSHNITLAIEDFGFTPKLMCTADDCLDVIHRSDGAVRLVFDTGNFEFAGEHADDNFDSLREHFAYVHFKDWRRASDPPQPDDGEPIGDFRGCPLGAGFVPNADIARRLLETDYDGWASLEVTAPADTPAQTVRRDLAVLKRWLGS